MSTTTDQAADRADRVDHVLSELSIILKELILASGRPDLLARLEKLGERP